MLGDIDYNLKPIKPKIFLAKPNREIVAKVSEGYDIKRDTSLTQLFTLSFKVPFYIDENNVSVRNRNVDILKERYHIKLVNGSKEEWYIVTKIMDTMGDKGDSKEIECVYLPQELNDKLIGGYEAESKHARQVLNDILSLSAIWSIGYIDADFELSYRSWEFPDNTLLDAIYMVAEKYNAIIEWDTENRTFDLIKPELHGINRLGTFNHSRYLKSIDKESNAEVVVTRLIPTGKDGLGIGRLTPNGATWLEDFSYWMFPFDRDSNKNVLKQSYFMSDELCNALLDYQEAYEASSGQFKTLIDLVDTMTSDLAQKRVELNNLKNELAAITQIQLAQQFDEMMFFDKSSYTGGTRTVNFPVDNLYYYAVMIKVGNTSGKTLTVNGQSGTMQSGAWVLSNKIYTSVSNISVSVNGSGSTDVFIQIANISQAEYNASGNGSSLVNKYNFDNKEMEISNKEAEILSLQSQIANVNAQIAAVRSALSYQNNFTQEQIEELDKFILVHNYVDETLIEDTDLYDEAKKRFNEYKIPQLEIKISVVNFLECIEEQRNWNQLYLGDKIIIKHDVFDMRIEAKIIEISYDYESSSIDLTIANFKDLSTNIEQFEKYIYDSKNTTSIVNDNKHKWNKAIVDNSEFSQIFENFWDKTTNQINMAINQTVQIADNGITVSDHNDPLRFIRITNGAIGLTRSGGLRYETALTPDGVIAEMLLGKIILSNRVTIGDDDGIWLTEGPKTTITDRCGRETMKLGLYEENPDLFGMIINRYDTSIACSPDIVNRVIVNSEDGFVIQKRDGAGFSDVAYLDVDGLLNVKKLQIDYADGVLSNGISIDATDGIIATRSDIMYRSLMSGIKGFAIQRNDRTPSDPRWVDMFSADLDGVIVADSIKIKNSFITDGGIEGAYIILRDGLGGVMKLYPQYGIWAGAEDAENAPFWVSPSGKFKLAGNGGSMFIDTQAGYMDLNSLNIIGAGRIEADSIVVNTAIAGTGIISNLAVNKLITIGQTDTIGAVSDYIHIEDNMFMLKTGEITGRTQLTSNGDLLFWSDSNKTTATTEQTPYPIWDLSVDSYDKLTIGFRGSGYDATPFLQMGRGDGILERSGKAFIEKPNGIWSFIYNNNSYGRERRLLFLNDGIELSVEVGYVEIKHDNGSSIRLNNNGTIDITATGQINISGSQYSFT